MRLSQLNIHEGGKRFDSSDRENEPSAINRKACQCGYDRTFKNLRTKLPHCVRCGRKAAA